jgi:hypothetical protein
MGAIRAYMYCRRSQASRFKLGLAVVNNLDAMRENIGLTTKFAKVWHIMPGIFSWKSVALDCQPLLVYDSKHLR